MDIFALTIRFVIVEIAHEYIAVSVVEGALALSFPLDPHANVLRSIGPDLCSETVLLLGLHFKLPAVNTAVANLKISDFLYSVHRFIRSGKFSIVDYVLYKVEVFGVREGARATRLQQLKCGLSSIMVR